MKRKIIILIAIIFISIGISSCEKDKMVIVNFELNHEALILEPVQINYKDQLEKPFVPMWEGYKFSGWYLDGELFDFNQKITKDMTLIGHWEKLIFFEVTFVYNYDNIVTTENIHQGEKLEEPTVPTRENYVFNGWYLDDLLFDFNEEITKDLTLNASWEEKEVLDVTFKDESSFLFDLDEFRLSEIVFNVIYNDGSTEELIATKEMLSDYDFESLFLTGPFYIHFLVKGKKLRAQITLTSDRPQTSLPEVTVYVLKEIIDNKDVYTFYSLGEGSFVSLEAELLINNGGSVGVLDYLDGLFAYYNEAGKLNIIYSFGKSLTGKNKLFSIEGDVGFSFSYVIFDVYKFIDGEVIKEESARFYIR